MSKTKKAGQPDAVDGDLEYVLACKKGNTEAFSVLVARHSQKMLNIACRMLGDYDEACDITQEAFLAAFRSLGKFRADAKFSTWLYRIVVNLAKNRVQTRQNLLKREVVQKLEAAVSGDCAAGLAASNGDNPALQLERRELAIQVQKCIDALEDDYRDVFVLRDIEGLAYEEIGGVLQIASGTVKSRLSRARLAMKECLKKVIGSL